MYSSISAHGTIPTSLQFLLHNNIRGHLQDLNHFIFPVNPHVNIGAFTKASQIKLDLSLPKLSPSILPLKYAQIVRLP